MYFPMEFFLLSINQYALPEINTELCMKLPHVLYTLMTNNGLYMGQLGMIC